MTSVLFLKACHKTSYGFFCVILCFTWYSLAVSKTLDLAVQDTASPAKSLEKLCLLLIDDVFYHIRILAQLWESITL